MKNIALALAIVAGFAGTAIANEEKAEVATTEVATTEASKDEKAVAPASETTEVSVEGEKSAEKAN